MIIYQIYPRSFCDANGDGIGDLPGIIEKLPHIASLGGVDFVWISPFFASPMRDFGYDVSNYYDVDPLFGTLEDLRSLLKLASSLGLAIMIDLVLAHSSSEHPWFQASRQSKANPHSDWYVWVDPRPDGCPPNNWLSNFGGPAWTWEPRRGQYYLHHFLPEQPALNWYNPAVETALLDVVKFWLDEGVRGFRLDALDFAHHDPMLRDNPPLPPTHGAFDPSYPYLFQEHIYDCGAPGGLAAVRRLRQLVDRYGGALLLGEVANRQSARQYTGPDLLHSTYFFDFLIPAPFTPQSIAQRLNTILSQFKPTEFAWTLSNHDFERHASRLMALANDQRPDFAKLCAALFLSLPGRYCLYQGEELGLPSAELQRADLRDPFDIALWPHGRGRDRARTPIPWDNHGANGGFTTRCGEVIYLPLDPKHLPLSVATQNQDNHSVLAFYRQLLAWRQRTEPSAYHLSIDEATENLLAYSLHSKGKNPDPVWICKFNLAPDQSLVCPVGPDPQHFQIDAISRGYNQVGSDSLELLPLGFVFLQRKDSLPVPISSPRESMVPSQ
ncbi:MAG: alpha-amylase family glycosyl hydrolase [Nodosilinea sp.]